MFENYRVAIVFYSSLIDSSILDEYPISIDRNTRCMYYGIDGKNYGNIELNARILNPLLTEYAFDNENISSNLKSVIIRISIDTIINNIRSYQHN